MNHKYFYPAHFSFPKLVYNHYESYAKLLCSSSVIRMAGAEAAAAAAASSIGLGLALNAQGYSWPLSLKAVVPLQQRNIKAFAVNCITI